MKYAIRYSKSFQYYSEIDEIVFDYSGKGDFVSFIPSLLKKSEQKAIINISEYKGDISTFIINVNKLKQEHSNIMVQLDFVTQQDYIQLLKDNNIDFMFANFAKNLSTVCAMHMLGAKDVYIVEDLCFSLKYIQKMREGGLRFRIYPNIAQTPPGCKDILSPAISFWVRPEDTNLYEQYVDVFELYPMGDRSSVVYEIYKKQQWLGQIDDIILDLNLPIENTGIAPHFGKSRINCHKKCTYNTCNICTEITQLADKFAKVGVQIIKKQNKPKIPAEAAEQEIEKLKEMGKDILNESEINEKNMQLGSE